MEVYLDRYADYLKKSKNMAENSLAAYRRDISEFHAHLAASGVNRPEDISNADIVSYVFSQNGLGALLLFFSVRRGDSE